MDAAPLKIDDVSPQSDPLILHLTSRMEVKAADRDLEVRVAYVYVIEAIGVGLHKIGFSNSIAGRFPSYRTECPVPCRPVIVAVVPQADALKIERAVHTHFRALRTKGEWFNLSQADLAELPSVMRRLARSSLNELSREIDRDGRYRLDEGALNDARAFERRIIETRWRNAVPTDELVMDRILCAREDGVTAAPLELVRGIDRKPQLVHDAIRYLIKAGDIAIRSPRRHPQDGSFYFDAYRNCGLLIPDETCDWEQTIEGYEIQVSEPLGTPVPEFFGRT